MNQKDALVWIAELFHLPTDKVQPETPRDSIPEWDSLGVLTLMADLDERFGLVMSDDDMRAMTKVGDILAVLRQNGKLQE
jgi:acyl carrier protein